MTNAAASSIDAWCLNERFQSDNAITGQRATTSLGTCFGLNVLLIDCTLAEMKTNRSDWMKNPVSLKKGRASLNTGALMVKQTPS